MRVVGNLIWLLLAGLWLCAAYLVAGVLNCLTIIGIPFGLQSFKLAGYALWPFGKAVVRRPGSIGAVSFVGNPHMADPWWVGPRTPPSGGWVAALRDRYRCSSGAWQFQDGPTGADAVWETRRSEAGLALNGSGDHRSGRGSPASVTQSQGSLWQATPLPSPSNPLGSEGSWSRKS